MNKEIMKLKVIEIIKPTLPGRNTYAVIELTDVPPFYLDRIGATFRLYGATYKAILNGQWVARWLDMQIIDQIEADRLSEILGSRCHAACTCQNE